MVNTAATNGDPYVNETSIPFFLFSEYYDVVRSSLATFSDECVSAVEKSFEQVEILLRHMIGQKSLNVKFKYVKNR